jgi:AcrR family transcriptional regulator
MAILAPGQHPDPTKGSEGRQRILDGSAALFLERSYAGTSLRGIASAVGMTPGSLYYHFSSKDALLEAILMRGIEVRVDAFRAAAESTLGSMGRERFAAHVRAHLAALFEHGPYTAAHVTTFRTAPTAVCAPIVPVRDAYEAMWTERLAGLKASGDLAGDVSVGLSRLVLFGAMNSAVEWFDPARGNLDDFSEAITRQFCTGLAT